MYFLKISYRFNDGITIEITKTLQSDKDELTREGAVIHVIVTNPRGEVIDDWTSCIRTSEALDAIREAVAISNENWRKRLACHDQTGDTYSATEVIDTFADALPETFRSSIFGKKSDILTSITSQIDCHLIETQR